MNTTSTPPAPPAKRPKRVRTPGGIGLGQEASRDAKRLASAVLEVLGGARTPTDAAAALGVSLPRYYQVESRALVGLLAACEPRPKGRGHNPKHDIEALRRQKECLQRELIRQQALVRAAHRTIGLAAPATPMPAKANGKSNGKSNGKKRRRQPVARALSVAARLHSANSDLNDGVPLNKENSGS
jgi:hypothetical protein